MAKPGAIIGVTEFETTNNYIKVIDIIEICLLVVILVDVVIKLSNHAMVMKSNFSNNSIMEE